MTNPFDRFVSGSPTGETTPMPVDAPATAINPFAKYALPSDKAASPSVAPAEAPEGLPLKDVPGTALGNLGANAKEKLSGLYSAIFEHPLSTLKNLNQTASAVFNPLADLEKAAKDEPSIYKSAMENIEQRYGSWDKVKETMARDPIGFLMDIGQFVPAAPKGTGALGKAATLAADPAKLVSEIPGVLASKVTTGAGNLAQLLSQTEHGVHGAALRDLFEGGEKVTPGVWSSLTKGLDPLEARAKLGDILHEMYDERGDNYLQGMQSVAGANTPVDFSKVDAAVAKAGGIGHYKAPGDLSAGPGYNFEKNDSIKAARADILAEIEKFRMMGPAYHTAYGFDKLKQAVQQIGENMKEANGMPSRGSAFANTIADSIVKTVSDAAPKYGSIMKQYHDDSNQIRNLMQEFSTGKPNSNPITTIKKLQSVWRNHANLGYGAKADFLRDLDQRYGGGDLMANLAADEYHQWTPRGLRGVALGVDLPLAAGHALFNPVTGLPHLGGALAGAAMMSPRLMGTAAYGAGRVAPAVRALGPAADVLRRAAPFAMRGQRLMGSEEPPAEAHGGYFSGRGR